MSKQKLPTVIEIYPLANSERAKVTGFIITEVADLGDDGIIRLCEQEPDFKLPEHTDTWWAIYATFANSGSICIADCTFKVDAENLLLLLSQMIELS